MVAVFHSVHNVIGKEVLGSNFQEDNEKQITGWTEAGFQLHFTTQATSFQRWKTKNAGDHLLRRLVILTDMKKPLWKTK